MCKEQVEANGNHEKANVSKIGQDKIRHKKHKGYENDGD
jgi:hypothetical protein